MEFNVGVLLPPLNTQNGVVNGVWAQKAVEIGLEFMEKRLNEESPKLQINLDFEIVGDDFEFENLTLVEAAVSRMQENETMAVIGPIRTSSARHLIDMGLKTNLVSSASGTELTENHYFFQIVPSNKEFANSIAATCFSLYFNHVNILYEDDDLYVNDTLSDFLNKLNMDRMSYTLFPLKEGYDQTDIASISSQLSNQSCNTIFFSSDRSTNETIHEFFEMIEDERVMDDGFVWIASDLFNRIDVSDFSDPLYQGILYTQPIDSEFANEVYFQQKMVEWLDSKDELDEIDRYFFYFDSIVAITNAILDYPDIFKNATSFSYQLNDVDFVGATGRVAFSYPDKERNYVGIGMYNVRDNQAVLVSQNSKTRLFKWESSNIVLHDGTKLTNALSSVPNQMNGWEKKPNMGLSPETSYGYCSCMLQPSIQYIGVSNQEIQIQDAMLIYGGVHGSIVYGDMYLLLLKDQTYYQVQYNLNGDSRSPTFYHSCEVFADEYIIVFGGITSNHEFEESTWVFDLDETRVEWIKLEKNYGEYPAPRIGASTMKVNASEDRDYIMLVGGRNQKAFLNDIWMFDLMEWGWNMYSYGGFDDDELIQVAFSTIFMNSQNEVFLWGGQTPKTKSGKGTSNLLIKITIDFSFDEYDYSIIFDQNEEEEGSQVQVNTPEGRFAFGSFVEEDMFYVLYGLGSNSESRYILDDFYYVDISNSSASEFEWIQIHPMNQTTDDAISHRAYFTIENWGGKGIIFGGLSDLDNGNDAVTDLHTFNPVTEEWIQVHGHFVSPKPLASFSSALLGNEIFIFFGFDSMLGVNNDVFKYSLLFKTWEDVSIEGTLPVPRSYQASVNMDSQFFVYGGIDEDGTILNDLWVFNMFEYSFKEVTLSDDTVSPPSLMHHTCTKLDNDRFIVLGGFSTSDAVVSNDVFYIFNNEEKVWEEKKIDLKASFDYPGSLIDCNSFYINGLLYLEGCMSREQPLDAVWVLDITNQTFVHKIEVPKAFRTSRHSSVLVNNDTAVYMGGYKGDFTVNNIFAKINFQKETFELIESELENRPPPINLLQCHYYKTQIVCLGGQTGALFEEYTDGTYNSSLSYKTRIYSATIVPNAIKSQLYVFNFNDICNSKLSITNDCFSCSKGTFEYYGGQICQMCPPGTYSQEYGSQECKKCPSGTMNSLTGANSEQLCIPCEFGTYQPSTGSSSCLKCPTNDYCPIGASTSYSANSYKKSRPKLTYPNQFEKDFQTKTIITAITYFLGLIVFLIFTILASVVLCFSRCLKFIKIEYVLYGDILYTSNHGVERNAKGKNHPSLVISKKTFAGAFCSVFALVVVICYIISASIVFGLGIDDNESRSLVPNLFRNESFTVDMVAELTFFDYTSGCSENNGQCVDDIVATTSNILYTKEGGKAKQECKRTSSSSCKVKWSCEDCEIGSSSSSDLQITVKTDSSSTSKFNYYLSLTTGYEKKKSKISEISGTIICEENYVFRGLHPSTTLDVLTIPSFYTRIKAFGDENGEGYYIDFSAIEEGSLVSIDTFSEENGFSFLFAMQETDYSLEIVRYNINTFYSFFPALLASCFALISLIGMVLKICEKGINFLHIPNDYVSWKKFTEKRKEKKRESEKEKEKELKDKTEIEYDKELKKKLENEEDDADDDEEEEEEVDGEDEISKI